MQYQHQVAAGYGAAPGMSHPAAGPYPPSPPPPPSSSYSPSPPNSSFYHPGSYSQQNYAPSSPMLSSSSSDYVVSYPGSAAPEGNYGQAPIYTPPPPDPGTYSYSSHDPSYSPRAPSFDGLPSHERSSFEQPAAWTSSGYGSAEYQYNRSSSYGGSYSMNSAADGSVYNQAPSSWGYDPAANNDVSSRSDTRYGGVPEKSYADNSGVDYSGVYAYDGGNSQPYGSRGTSTARWNSQSNNPLGDLPKLAKALPKVETETRGGGIQKYHVKLLQDSSSLGLPTNVLCQIGLDGVRLVDPGSGRNLRIYPLDTITKWEVNEPSVFTFWAKSAVDYEQRRTRLQSSSSTTNAILDTLTAACVQLCEMVGKDGDTGKSSTTSNNVPEKKASFSEWLVRPKAAAQEEKDHWVPDEAVTKCTSCSSDFGPFLRRHHCRNCGDIFCDKCTRGRTALTSDEDAQPVRVCDRCLAEVTQRLTNSKESSNKFSSQQTHEDLAKKLQEEMERNAPVRKTVDKSGQTSLFNCAKCGSISIVTGRTARCPSCGSESPGGKNGVTKRTSRSSDGSRRRTREVACPTCTVHLEVEVPSYGSETVECGVCQHPFLVNA